MNGAYVSFGTNNPSIFHVPQVLFAWRDFIEINKKEKAKILQALEIRRTWLLENCTQKWFQVSTVVVSSILNLVSQLWVRLDTFTRLKIPSIQNFA